MHLLNVVVSSYTFSLKVPPGVVVVDDATGRILKDFNRPGEKVSRKLGLYCTAYNTPNYGHVP